MYVARNVQYARHAIARIKGIILNCSNSTSNDQVSIITGAILERAISDSPTEEPTEEPTEAPSGEVTAAESVLVDKKGVKITLKKLEDEGFLGPRLKLLIENDSGKALTFSVKDVSVNGYMNDAMLYTDVADGKKANDEVILSDSDLEACGITTIADIELSFHVIKSDGWDEYLDTDPIVIKTSAYEGFEYTYDESGTVAFDKKGIKVVVKGLTDESILGPGIVFYINNTTGKSITVSTRDVSVNGFMVDDVFYCDVAPGKHAVDSSTFMSSSLEENDIEEIEEVELSFHITDADSWKTIADSDPVNIKFD